MQKIMFVLGGSRSGKSTFALKKTSAVSGKKAFIATAECLDEEMRGRIEKHRQERNKDWVTYEEPLYIAQLIEKIRGEYDVVLIDCLTLWLSNIMHAGLDEEDEVKKLALAISGNCPPCSILFQMKSVWGLFLNLPWGGNTGTTSGF